MRSARKFIVVIGTLLAPAVLAPPASAAPALKPIEIAKECSEYTGDVPSFCTVTESNVAAIPAGTKIFYYGPVISNPLFTSSSVVIDAGVGNTAVGHCIVDDEGTPPLGMCAFAAGSGSLAGFQAILKVTVDDKDKQVYHWKGGYLLGPAN